MKFNRKLRESQSTTLTHVKIFLVVKAYIIAVAMKLLNLQILSDVPSEEFATHGDVKWTSTVEERSSRLYNQLLRNSCPLITMLKSAFCLHCKHLNRLCETSITNLQSNKTTRLKCAE